MTEPNGSIEGIHNFRVLAPYRLAHGGRIRPGMVFRSGALERMTRADQAHLSETLGIRNILDLRHPDELAFVATEHDLQPLVVGLSVFPEGSVQEDMIGELNMLYGTGPTPGRYLHYLEVGGPQWARAFQLLAEASFYPALVHCTAGKDRTGVLIGLLMDLLGASDADIADEYGLSTASYEGLLAYLHAIGRKPEGTPEELKARYGTPPRQMAGFIELLRERHGSAEEYLKGRGVSDGDLASIRILLVEPGAGSQQS